MAKWTMLRYIIPRIRRVDLRPMIRVAVAGGLFGGAYGIVHDQVSYTISPEYFTKLKFHQFDYANLGLGDRFFASTVGFLATWWVGLIAAWFLARRLVPNQPPAAAYRQIRAGFICVFGSALSFGIAGYVYGLARGPDADYSAWAWAIERFEVTDAWSFVRVAYIHNAGYLGGAVGLIVALATIRPRKTVERTEEARSA